MVLDTPLNFRTHMHPKSNAFLLAITVAITMPPQTGFCAPSNSSCWRLRQNHKLNGKQNLYIGENKWRLENTDLGYTLIADGSKGMIDVFNKNKKLRYRSRFADFNCNAVRLVRVVSGEELKDLSWKRISNKNSLRRSPQTYFQATTERTCFRGSSSGGFLAGAKYKVHVRYTLAVSNEIKLPGNTAKVLSDFQGAPNLGIPVQEIIEYSDRSKPTCNLETIEMMHVPMTANLWIAPKEYKETKQIADVVTSGDTSLLEDFANHAIK